MQIRILLFTPNIMNSLGLFTETLNLKCNHLSETFAELQDSSGTILYLSKSPSLAYTFSGFTPLLLFQTNNYEECLSKSLKYGCVQEPNPPKSPIGKISYLKSPEGLSFAIKEIIEKDIQAPSQSTDHPASEELKNFIKKLNL